PRYPIREAWRQNDGYRGVVAQEDAGPSFKCHSCRRLRLRFERGFWADAVYCRKCKDGRDFLARPQLRQGQHSAAGEQGNGSRRGWPVGGGYIGAPETGRALKMQSAEQQSMDSARRCRIQALRQGPEGDRGVRSAIIETDIMPLHPR